MLCVFFAGCDQRNVNKSAFDSAKPEVKQTWQAALAASKANNYLSASTNFLSLISRDITPTQLVAVQDAMAGLTERMYQAAAKGDAGAKAALDALKQRQAEQMRALTHPAH